MDGKNIADFIDPDILERLDALKREEEKLEAEGFYDMESEMLCYGCLLWCFTFARAYTDDIRFEYDSEDEREAVSAKAAREKKLV